MIGLTVRHIGRLWDRPDIEAALIPVIAAGTQLVKRVGTDKLRAIGRGPGRFGHVADSLVAETRHLAGQILVGIVEPRGKPRFKAIFLEGGTAPHPIARRGRLRARGTGRQRVLALRGKGGGLFFRQNVAHPGAPAFHWSLRTQRETSPQIVRLFEDALAKVAHDA